jgi:DNA-binding MarR family transcriptional regulator
VSSTTRPSDAVTIASRLRLSATRLARRLRQEDQTGLSPSQLSALSTVEKCGPMTLGALAAKERVAPPTTTRVVGKLLEQGLVAREPDPDDRRVHRVGVTADGRAVLSESRRRKTAWLADRLATLDDDARAALARALDALDAILDEEAR